MDFSQTYLYKLRKLTTNLDKILDQTLHMHSTISLSQFTFLLAINTLGKASQQKIASFLAISTPAVSRQADIAYENGWIKRKSSPIDRHGYILVLTASGKKIISHGLKTLETHVFKIFENAYQQADLMSHIDSLLNNLKGVSEEQTLLKQRERLTEKSIL